MSKLILGTKFLKKSAPSGLILAFLVSAVSLSIIFNLFFWQPVFALECQVGSPNSLPCNYSVRYSDQPPGQEGVENSGLSQCSWEIWSGDVRTSCLNGTCTLFGDCSSSGARTIELNSSNCHSDSCLIVAKAKDNAGNISSKRFEFDTVFNRGPSCVSLSGAGGGPVPSISPSPSGSPPPAGKSKLGLQLNCGSGDFWSFIDAKPTAVKLMDDFGCAAQIKTRSPSTLIVGRIYNASQPIDGTPEDRARQWFNANQSKFTSNPSVDCWEGYNEEGGGSVSELTWYGRFEAERVRLLAGIGRKACIGNFGSGGPTAPEEDSSASWNAFRPALEAAKANGGYLGLHEYSAPGMKCMFDSGSGEGWLTGRYRKVYRDYLIPNNLSIPLVITELGTTTMICQQQSVACGCAGKIDQSLWNQDKGWRSYTSAQSYADELKWYDSLLKADNYVIGSTIFVSGLSSWSTFETTPELTGPEGLLTNYVKSSAREDRNRTLAVSSLPQTKNIFQELWNNFRSPLTALAAPAFSGLAPLSVHFTASGSDPDPGNTIAEYQWDFNGDGAWDETTTINTADHLYSSAGSYCAKVRVADSQGVWSGNTGECGAVASPLPTPSPAPNDQTWWCSNRWTPSCTGSWSEVLSVWPQIEQAYGVNFDLPSSEPPVEWADGVWVVTYRESGVAKSRVLTISEPRKVWPVGTYNGQRYVIFGDCGNLAWQPVSDTCTMTVAASQATLSVDLKVAKDATNWQDSLTGDAPLNGVDLKATVSGTAQGTINYKFDCTNDGVWDHVFDNVSDNPKIVGNGCYYPNSGTYTAKVKVERDGAPAAGDTVQITVNPSTNPSVDIKANNSDGPITIDYNAVATLSWTGTNATSCIASGGWSGSKDVSGSESTGNLTSSKTYTIVCSGPGGTSDPDSVTVNVRSTLEVKLQVAKDNLNWRDSLAGAAPLNGVDLKAMVSGTAQGTINYKFDCTSDGTWDKIFDNVNDNPKIVQDACNYSNPGTYTVKVKTERDTAAPAEDTVQIIVSANQSPQALFSCDASLCGAGSSSANCIGYQSCPFKLNNLSSDPNGNDDIQSTLWTSKDKITGAVRDTLNCSLSNLLCDYSLPATLSPKIYNVEIKVTDSSNVSDTFNKDVTIRRDITADFVCSIDNTLWQACDSATFKVAKGIKVYFHDNLADSVLSSFGLAGKKSVVSEGADRITKRVWTKDGVVFSTCQNGAGCTNSNPFTKIESTEVKLEIEDNLGRTAAASFEIKTKLPLPEWEEIPPL